MEQVSSFNIYTFTLLRAGARGPHAPGSLSNRLGMGFACTVLLVSMKLDVGIRFPLPKADSESRWACFEAAIFGEDGRGVEMYSRRNGGGSSHDAARLCILSLVLCLQVAVCSNSYFKCPAARKFRARHLSMYRVAGRSRSMHDCPDSR